MIPSLRGELELAFGADLILSTALAVFYALSWNSSRKAPYREWGLAWLASSLRYGTQLLTVGRAGSTVASLIIPASRLLAWSLIPLGLWKATENRRCRGRKTTLPSAFGAVMAIWGALEIGTATVYHTAGASYVPYAYILCGFCAATASLLATLIANTEIESLLQTLVGAARDPILIVAADGQVVDANDAAAEFYGYGRDGLLGKAVSTLEDQGPPSEVDERSSDDGSSDLLYKAIHHRADGRHSSVEVSSRTVIVDGEPLAIAIVRELSSRGIRAGHVDPITGLHTSAFITEEANQLLSSGAANVGLVLCDVDGLKLVNDTLGIGCGDELLRGARNILLECFSKGETIARLGRDEFAVVVPTATEHGLAGVTRRIEGAADRHKPKDARLTLRVSVGYAVGRAGEISFEQLVSQAESAKRRRKHSVEQTHREAIVQTLMTVLRARDYETDDHTSRLQTSVNNIWLSLGLDRAKLDDIGLFARFHDIGKIGIPDSILLKAGPLTPVEWKEMRRHSEIGYQIALSSPELERIAKWILSHHERWDGTGYPLGVKAEQIPLECRILAIADAYDAMTSNRPYRRAMTPGEALAEIGRCSGSQFDPVLVDRCTSILASSLTA